jgi:cystathionine beta-lyase/cystathionine gamma-synthase
VGQVEGGHAVAFSSGMAAVAAVLDLVPSGGRIVAPTDCYLGVGELLADGQQHDRWAVDRVDLTETASVQAAVAGQGHLPPGLLRLSAGCEHIDDLWNDLNAALEQAIRPQNPT